MQQATVNTSLECASTSSLTFIGQNLGAGERKRVKISFYECFLLSVSSALVLGLAAYFSGEFLFSFYVDTPEGIHYAMIRASFIVAPYFISAMNSSFASTLQAFGYSAFTSLNSIFSVFVFRMIWMNFIYPKFPTYVCVFWCFLISWIIMLLTNFVMTIIVFSKYKKGTLKRIT